MKIKRILSLVIVSLLFSCLLQSENILAKTGDLAGEKKSDYAYAINDLYERELLSGIMLYKQQVKTLQNGVGSTWNYSTIQWIDIPATSKNLNVVTWTYSTKDEWDSRTVRQIASDYESKHPGWIVLAGINGDFFDINATGEPTNIHVQEGETYRPHSIGDINYRAELGFINNDFTKVINGPATIDSNLSIEVIRDGAVVDTKIASSINGGLSETGINVLTKDFSGTADLTGYKVLIGNYDIVRTVSGNNKKIFVKGNIVAENTFEQISSIPRGEFYLASKDGSLDGFIENGDYVRCQHRLTGDWANVQYALGYIYQILNNGKVQNKNSSVEFVKTLHPRTFIGYKEDGSVVMMVCDGRGKSTDCQEGMTLFQGGEMMRLAGCVNAFNLDGGGSSTLLVRNERGGFETINNPSDKTERSDGNAVLVVMKDSKIDFNAKEITRNSVVFTREKNDEIKNITIKVNNQVYDFTSERIEINGLEENTEYVVEITYETPSLQDKNAIVKCKNKTTIKTKGFIAPDSGLYIEEVGKNSITIRKEETEYSSWIQNVTIDVSGTQYFMGNESLFVIDGLLDSTKYIIKITYNVVEPGNSKLYSYELGPYTETTLSYSMPIVEKFEIENSTINSIKIAYQYDDEDRIAKEIYAVVYDATSKEVTRQKIEKKRGTIEFTNLNLSLQKYSVKLLFLYNKEGDANLSKYYSEAIETELIELENKEPSKKKTCKKSTGEYLIATLSVLSLATLLIRRKK